MPDLQDCELDRTTVENVRGSHDIPRKQNVRHCKLATFPSFRRSQGISSVARQRFSNHGRRKDMENGPMLRAGVASEICGSCERFLNS